MIITTPSLAAAWRIRERCTVRTVAARPAPRRPREYPEPGSPVVAERRQRVREMLDDGLTRDEIGARLGISRTAVANHIRAIRHGHYNHRKGGL